MENFDALISFFSSPLLDILVKGALIYLAVLWFAVVIWVARDVVNRSNNILFQVAVILLNIILPVFGLVLYLIIRPSKTLLERSYEELEYGFIAEQASDDRCSRCEAHLNGDYLFCPECSNTVRKKCVGCRHVYLAQYIVCPYCGRKEKKGGVKETGKKAVEKAHFLS